MKNILLIGEWKSPNLGDSVLCNCCKIFLEKELPHINFIQLDLSFGINPSRHQYWCYSKLYKISRIFEKIIRSNRNSLSVQLSYFRSKIFIKKSLERLSSIEGIIFCGGQIFLDYFSYCILEIVYYAEDKKIPIFWNACGGSEMTKKVSDIIQRCIQSPMTISISVRDNIDYFRSIIPKTILVPDTALLSSELYSFEPVNSDIIGLGILSIGLLQERLHGTFKKRDLLIFWKEVIRNIERRGLKWQFFTNGDTDDYSTAIELLIQLGYDISEENLAARPKSDNELVGLISKYESIISFRLHSHIIAFSLGIPSYGLAWDKKVIDFFILSQRIDYCSNLGKFNANEAIKVVDNRKKILYQKQLIEKVKMHMHNDIINRINV